MDKYFSIGEVSKITGLSIDRLRNYDKIGLLKPSYIDPKSGYRYYSENKFRKLRIIKYLRKIGTPLKEIDLILNKNIDSQEFVKFLELKIKDIEKEIENLNMIKEDINEIKHTFECNFKLSNINYIHKKYLNERYVVKKSLKKNINFVVSHREQVFSKFKSEINGLEPPRSLEKGLYLHSLEDLENNNTEVYMLLKDYENIHNFIIPKGNYLCLSYKENERDKAIFKLKSYIQEHNIKVKGPILNLVLTTLPKEEFQFQILI